MTEKQREQEIRRARQEIRGLVLMGRRMREENLKEYARQRYKAWAVYLKRLEEKKQDRILPMPLLTMMEEETEPFGDRKSRKI